MYCAQCADQQVMSSTELWRPLLEGAIMRPEAVPEGGVRPFFGGCEVGEARSDRRGGTAGWNSPVLAFPGNAHFGKRMFEEWLRLLDSGKARGHLSEADR